MEENKNQIVSYIVVGLVVVAAIWGFVHFNGNGGGTATSTAGPSNAQLDVFAKCVADKGLTMYGAAWCSHCAAEKKAFGESFRFIKYVECPDNIKLCTDLGINGYPTWIDSAGKKYEGEQGLAGIAKITGCELPKTD